MKGRAKGTYGVWRWVVSRSLSNPLYRNSVTATAGLDAKNWNISCFCRESNSCSSVVRPVVLRHTYWAIPAVGYAMGQLFNCWLDDIVSIWENLQYDTRDMITGYNSRRQCGGRRRLLLRQINGLSWQDKSIVRRCTSNTIFFIFFKNGKTRQRRESCLTTSILLTPCCKYRYMWGKARKPLTSLEEHLKNLPGHLITQLWNDSDKLTSNIPSTFSTVYRQSLKVRKNLFLKR
jgi:hypothetical protein